MKLNFSIVIRRYGERFAIAETAGALEVSAAGDSPEEARAALELHLLERLERTHPARLATMTGPLGMTERSEQLAIYKNRTTGGPESPERLERPVELVTERYGESIHRIWAPSFGQSQWYTDGEDRAREALAAGLRSDERHADRHPRAADEVFFDELTVSFRPLDLTTLDEPAPLPSPAYEATVEGESESPTATLEQIGETWTISEEAARRRRGIDDIFGRRSLIEQLDELLAGEHPAAVVLVGPPRSGKTALIKHLAWQTSHQSEALGGRRLWFADPTRLTSLRSAFDSWRSQCRRAFDELEGADDLLYLGRLVEALDAGKSIQSNYNLAQFLKPLLDDRRIRLVAEATAAEWNDVERRDLAFARTFDVVRVDEPPDVEGRRIMERAARRSADRRDIAIEAGALDRVWRLQTRFTTEGSAFGRSIDFAERALRRAERAYQDELTSGEVVEHFCEETGLPAELLRDDRELDLDEVRDRLEERVMGQPAAVGRVADVIGITKADLGARDRPLGVFFFVGPTGVGKTELAKALAEFMFGDEERLIRLDMSEYARPGAHARLIGEQGSNGDLTAPVRRQPFSVVLLDEVEKADGGVFDLLLQVFGEARLTDADGRTTHFQNTIVVMTSNLGVEGASSIGFGSSGPGQDWVRRFRKATEEYFRPEFVGRIDQFVPFRPLPREVVVDIARRQLDELGDRLGIRRRGLALEIDESVVRWVAEHGWDAEYGARPVERVVEQQIAWPMGNYLADWEGEGRPVALQIDIADQGAEEARPVFDCRVEPTEEGEAVGDRLIDPVERIAGLRRRVQTYTTGKGFASLVETVEYYDRASETDAFWENNESAAQQARRAEEARQVVEPSRELVDELGALEDLMREAYHRRQPEVMAELAGPLPELEEKVDDLYLTLLGWSHHKPDEAVLSIRCDHPEDPIRDQLVEWYRLLADRRGWKFQLWQAIPKPERRRDLEPSDDFKREDLWRTQKAPQGRLVAVQFKGKSARPLMEQEQGRHRFVTEDGPAELDVLMHDAFDTWPHPDSVEGWRIGGHPTRTWNFIDGEIKSRAEESVPLDPEDPWPALIGLIESLAWESARWS